MVLKSMGKCNKDVTPLELHLSCTNLSQWNSKSHTLATVYVDLLSVCMQSHTYQHWANTSITAMNNPASQIQTLNTDWARVNSVQWKCALAAKIQALIPVWPGDVRQVDINNASTCWHTYPQHTVKHINVCIQADIQRVTCTCFGKFHEEADSQGSCFNIKIPSHQ